MVVLDLVVILLEQLVTLPLLVPLKETLEQPDYLLVLIMAEVVVELLVLDQDQMEQEELVLLLLFIQEALKHSQEVVAVVFNQDLHKHQAESEVVVKVDLVNLDPVDRGEQDKLALAEVVAVEHIQELLQQRAQ